MLIAVGNNDFVAVLHAEAVGEYEHVSVRDGVAGGVNIFSVQFHRDRAVKKDAVAQDDVVGSRRLCGVLDCSRSDIRRSSVVANRDAIPHEREAGDGDGLAFECIFIGGGGDNDGGGGFGYDCMGKGDGAVRCDQLFSNGLFHVRGVKIPVGDRDAVVIADAIFEDDAVADASTSADDAVFAGRYGDVDGCNRGDRIGDGDDLVRQSDCISLDLQGF